jgi:purine-binding chemotaxis protein CheW
MIDAASSAMLVARAGAHRCALPAQEVVEVMRRQPVRMIASLAACIEGLAVIRGEAVPVVSLTRLFDPAATETAGRFISVRIGQRRVALAVSEVLGMRQLPARQIAALPPLLGAVERSAVAGLEVLDLQLLLVLNCARLISDRDWADLAKDQGA